MAIVMVAIWQSWISLLLWSKNALIPVLVIFI
jgi:hypothetical protein